MGRVRGPARSGCVRLAIFALTRLYGFVVIALAARHQVALPSPAHPGIYQFSAHPDSPGYLGLITNWDGQWYERIATIGYHLPGAGASGAKETLWTYAFLPGFPAVVGAMMALTGLSFAVCVTVVNLVAGGAAMVVMFALVERTAGRFAAGAAVLFTNCFVAAPLFQAAYSESIALLLVCTVLLLVAQRRYAWAMTAVILLSLTRPVTPPLAVVVLIHALVRYRGRAQDPVRRGEVVWMAALAVVSAASVSFWSTITSVITGGAQTTGANRGSVSDAVVGRQVRLVHQRVRAHRLDRGRRPRPPGRRVRGAGAQPADPDVGSRCGTWFAIYPIFLLFVAGVHTGMLRYLLLAFPLGLLILGSPPPGAIPRKRAALVVIVSLIGLGLQIPWVSHALVVTQLAGKPWLP